jgi:RNA polymerase sigma-70 factor (ECF subfamily)
MSEPDPEQGQADAQLVRATLDGEEGAFETLVARYKSLMILVAYRNCGSESDSEDVAQEALLRIYNKLSTLADPSKFKSWAMRIAANVALDLARRRKKTVSIDDDKLAPDLLERGSGKTHGDGVREFEIAEMRERIAAAIDDLPDAYHLPAVLRYVEDLSYKEIAVRMGLREDALRKRIHRANQILRQVLEPLMREEA